MSNESLSGLEKAKFCPHCRSRLEYEGTSCPNCGKQITDVNTAGAVKRPLSLAIIAAIWLIAGLNNVLNPISILVVDSTANWAYLKFGLGVIYIGTAFGLWIGKRWSYTLAFLAVGLGVVLGTLSIVPNPQMFRVNFNLIPLVWAVIVWYYLKKPTAKEYLGVTKSEKIKWKIIAGLLIGVAIQAAIGYYIMEEHLALTNITFCTVKPYDSSYQPKPNATYISGDTVWMYLECYRFECSKKNNEYVTLLYVTLEVFDSHGSCIEESVHSVEVSKEMKPSFIWLHLWIETDGFEEGRYSVRITVVDELSEKSQTAGGSFFITEK